MEVKIQEWQWNIIKEVLYDYLDEYDHREDVRQVLIKVAEGEKVYSEQDYEEYAQLMWLINNNKV